MDVGLCILWGFTVHCYRCALANTVKEFAIVYKHGYCLIILIFICFSASSDNLARLWCVETGEIKREYSGHQKAVVCLAFNDSVLG